MTLDEVQRIVRRTPGVGSVSKPFGRGSTVVWFWNKPLWWYPDTEECGVSMSGGVVTNISLSFAADVTVGEIIAKYGPPDLVSHSTAGLPEHRYYWLGMFYPTRGYQFNVQVDPYLQPVLEPKSLVYSAVYFRPYASLQAWEPVPHPGVLRLPWPGYGPLARSDR
jgi:hypothetical protein